MTTPPPEPPKDVRLNLNLPPEQEAGAYASFASIWHDDNGFIFDFGVPTTPPQMVTDEATGQQMLVLPAKIVSRVRIPASQAFEFMKALNTQLAAWELEHGQAPAEPPGSPSN